MKMFPFSLLLFTTSISAQTTFKSLQSFEETPITAGSRAFSPQQFRTVELNLGDLSGTDQLDHKSNLRQYTQSQMGRFYPTCDLEDMTDMMLGTALTNTLKLGRRNINTTYFFDALGNLQNVETSFTLGRDKR